MLTPLLALPAIQPFALTAQPQVADGRITGFRARLANVSKASRWAYEIDPATTQMFLTVDRPSFWSPPRIIGCPGVARYRFHLLKPGDPLVGDVGIPTELRPGRYSIGVDYNDSSSNRESKSSHWQRRSEAGHLRSEVFRVVEDSSGALVLKN